MPLLPIRTERLTVRLMEVGDAPALSAYRSLPEVARHQSWDPPYPEERARAMLASQAHLPGPTPGEWVQLAVEHEGETVGDVAVHLDDRGAVAEIGFTLHPAHQGRGLATEAAGAVVDALLTDGVHRVEARVDPRNRASRRLLERLGFRHEGTARLAFPTANGWEDDELWSLLGPDRERARERPAPPKEVRLVELGATNARTYGRLRTQTTQEHFVATVWESYADALFVDTDDAGGLLVPWLRGIEADGVPAGFVMLAAATATSPVPYLWRLLVDGEQQGRGIGRRVIGMLVEQLRAEGHTSMLTSWVVEPGGPEPFYRQLGFVPTGEVDDGEVVARLDLGEWEGGRAVG